MPTYRSRHISITVEKPFADVYAFMSNPTTIPHWSSGIGHSFELVGPHEWTGETSTGLVTVFFSAPNESGILDHRIVPDGSEALFVPMRVVPNGTGSEVIITLFQWPGLSDAYFERDAETTSKDMLTLKRLLEAE
jgi:hypothetical protein